jgi:hypothetical protein
MSSSSERGADRGSICQTCSSAGARRRRPAIISARPAVSAKHARAPESDRIHSACSAEEVSYTGTLTAPAAQIA